MEAAGIGDLVAVNGLLKLGANAKETSRHHGVTALHLAAANGHGEICATLLKAGADVNAPALDHLTPLILAAGKGHEEAVRILLKGGADANARERRFLWTVLMFACLVSNENVVNLLIEARADVHSRTVDDITPLHIASERGPLTIVKALVNRRAYVNDRDKEDCTPLTRAIQAGQTEIADFLRVHGAIDLTTYEIPDLRPLPEVKAPPPERRWLQ